MNRYVERLLARMPPPGAGGDLLDWDEVRAGSGLGFPDDYRDFVTAYGGGVVDDYLSVSTPPVAGSVYGDIEFGFSPAVDVAYDFEDVPDSLREGRLLRWGTTSEADDVFWLHDPAGPSRWGTAVRRRHHDHDESAWITFDVGMAEFLLRVIDRDIPPCFSQGDFPSAFPRYLNWREEARGFEGSQGESSGW
jgi:hypothetical protein